MNQLIAGTGAGVVMLALVFAAFMGWFALVDSAVSEDAEAAALLDERPELVIDLYHRAWQNEDKDGVRWSFFFGHIFVGYLIWSLAAAAYGKIMEWLEGGPFYCNRCGEELPPGKATSGPVTGKEDEVTACGQCKVCKAREDYDLPPSGWHCAEYADRLGGAEADECWTGDDCGSCDGCNTVPLYAGLT